MRKTTEYSRREQQGVYMNVGGTKVGTAWSVHASEPLQVQFPLPGCPSLSLLPTHPLWWFKLC